MISGSSYSRSVPQPDVITRPVTAARVLRLYSRALERAVTRRYSIFYRIGSCNSLVLRVSGIWQFAFPTFVASNNCAGDRFKQAET